MRNFLSIVLAAIIICSSCKKDKATNACSNSMANLAGTYSIVKIEANLFGTFSDVTGQYFKSCELDDKIILDANGTANYSDAGTACDPNGTVAGTWSVSST